jgi:hypothetical protein
MEQNQKEVKIQIKGSDAVMGGVYANNFMVHMNRDEFVIDFVNVVPPQATLNARTVIAPANFKKLMQIMAETMRKYETEFGAVGNVAQRAEAESPLIQ